jgi:outer membrane protein assembly factor BamB
MRISQASTRLLSVRVPVFLAVTLGAGLAAAAIPAERVPAADRDPLPPGPWTKTLGPDAPEPTVAGLFRLPPPQPPFGEPALREWLADVTKSPRTFSVNPTTLATTIAGQSRLVPPLHAGTALRMLVTDPAELRIVAWCGNRGAKIVMDGAPHALRWCGMVLSRPAADKPVESLWLASTSDGRGHRCGAGLHPGNVSFTGILELRYVDGALVLSRGEVRLVEVPLPGEPDEVLIEGSYTILGLELVRAVAPPPLPEPPSLTAEWQPADIVWEGSGKDAVEKCADGGVRLAQTDPAPKAPLLATWKLPPPEFGPREIVLKIDECSPGTGVYLAGPEGQGGFVLGFVAPTPGGPPDSQGLLMTSCPPDKSLLAGGDPSNPSVVFTPRPLWLRLTMVDQLLVISWSVDGRNWARLRWFPTVAIPGGIGTVGLFVGSHLNAAITLAQLGVAELPGFARILPRDLLAAVNPALVTETDAKRSGEWVEATLKAKPAGVDEPRWLVAAAIRCLATSRTNLTGDLCAIACRYAQEADLSLADRLAVCDDVNRLTTTTNQHDGTVYTGIYGVVARQCVDQGDVAGYRAAWLRMQQAPSDILYLIPFGSQVDLLGVRDRIVKRLLITDPKGDLPDEIARQRFYENGAGFATGVAGQIRDGGPVVFDTDIRLTNAAKEFAAAIAHNDWSDAQRVLARCPAEAVAAASKLVEHPADPGRLVTLPVLVAAAVRDRPGFRDFMRGEPEKRGRLRLSQLFAVRDAEGVSAAALEFAGTPAAANAHEWLAERSLSGGDFAIAREHAVAGLESATVETAGRLVSLRALAEALGGAGARGQPQAGFAGAAVADIAEVVAAAPVPAPIVDPTLQPADLEAAKRLDLNAEPAKERYSSHADSIRDAPIGEQFRKFIPPYFYLQRLDWGAEVCSLTPARGRLLVNNRVELVSVDSATGAVQWRLPPGATPGGLDSLGPGLVPMRPCCDDRHAYLRRLAHGHASTVAAVRLADGVIAWESPATSTHSPISDPVLVDGGLQFFEMRPGLNNELTFVVVDPTSGARRIERVVGVVLPGWQVRRHKHDGKNMESGDCQVRVADSRLFVTIGGSVFCCQANGQLRWARQLPWLSADLDGWWRYQAQTPPLVHDGKVFLMQPGFPGIAAVDAADGRLLWKMPLVGPRRLVGIAGAGDAARLVVETADGILACHPRDGTTRIIFESRDGPGDAWLGIAPTRLVGPPLATADGRVIVAMQRRRADTVATNTVDVDIVWIDALSAAVQKTAEVPSLNGLNGKPPWVGPLATAGGRVWTLSFADPADMRRALWELAPKPAP